MKIKTSIIRNIILLTLLHKIIYINCSSLTVDPLTTEKAPVTLHSMAEKYLNHPQTCAYWQNVLFESFYLKTYLDDFLFDSTANSVYTPFPLLKHFEKYCAGDKEFCIPMPIFSLVCVRGFTLFTQYYKAFAQTYLSNNFLYKITCIPTIDSIVIPKLINIRLKNEALEKQSKLIDLNKVFDERLNIITHKEKVKQTLNNLHDMYEKLYLNLDKARKMTLPCAIQNILSNQTCSIKDLNVLHNLLIELQTNSSTEILKYKKAINYIDRKVMLEERSDKDAIETKDTTKKALMYAIEKQNKKTSTYNSCMPIITLISKDAAEIIKLLENNKDLWIFQDINIDTLTINNIQEILKQKIEVDYEKRNASDSCLLAILVNSIACYNFDLYKKCLGVNNNFELNDQNNHILFDLTYYKIYQYLWADFPVDISLQNIPPDNNVPGEHVIKYQELIINWLNKIACYDLSLQTTLFKKENSILLGNQEGDIKIPKEVRTKLPNSQLTIFPFCSLGYHFLNHITTIQENNTLCTIKPNNKEKTIHIDGIYCFLKLKSAFHGMRKKNALSKIQTYIINIYDRWLSDEDLKNFEDTIISLQKDEHIKIFFKIIPPTYVRFLNNNQFIPNQFLFRSLMFIHNTSLSKNYALKYALNNIIPQEKLSTVDTLYIDSDILQDVKEYKIDRTISLINELKSIFNIIILKYRSDIFESIKLIIQNSPNQINVDIRSISFQAWTKIITISNVNWKSCENIDLKPEEYEKIISDETNFHKIPDTAIFLLHYNTYKCLKIKKTNYATLPNLKYTISNEDYCIADSSLIEKITLLRKIKPFKEKLQKTFAKKKLLISHIVNDLFDLTDVTYIFDKILFLANYRTISTLAYMNNDNHRYTLKLPPRLEEKEAANIMLFTEKKNVDFDFTDSKEIIICGQIIDAKCFKTFINRIPKHITIVLDKYFREATLEFTTAFDKLSIVFRTALITQENVVPYHQSLSRIISFFRSLADYKDGKNTLVPKINHKQANQNQTIIFEHREKNESDNTILNLSKLNDFSTDKKDLEEFKSFCLSFKKVIIYYNSFIYDEKYKEILKIIDEITLIMPSSVDHSSLKEYINDKRIVFDWSKTEYIDILQEEIQNNDLSINNLPDTIKYKIKDGESITEKTLLELKKIVEDQQHINPHNNKRDASDTSKLESQDNDIQATQPFQLDKSKNNNVKLNESADNKNNHQPFDKNAHKSTEPTYRYFLKKILKLFLFVLSKISFNLFT